VAKEQLQSLSIPEAGRRYLGLSRNAAYRAAEDGHIPYIKVGRLKRVPVRAMERLLDNVGKFKMVEPAAYEPKTPG
jgi:excisionase family DNA binding protein